MKIVLTNDFHRTSVVLLLQSSFLTDAQIKRSWKNLCGIHSCTCSGVTGFRGPQSAHIIGEEFTAAGLVPQFLYEKFILDHKIFVGDSK